MALTIEQTNWFQGFWSFFQGSARPTKAGSKRDGWDAANIVGSGSNSHGGGYA